MRPTSWPTPTNSSGSPRTSRYTSRARRHRGSSRANRSHRTRSSTSVEIFAKQAQESNKPEHVIDTIVDGKLSAYYRDIVLVDQPYVKDDTKTVQQLLDEISAKVGEKVAVRRFVRYKLGEEGIGPSLHEPDDRQGAARMAHDGGTTRTHYNRVLLKLSGEAFAPAERGSGINTDATALVARQLAEVVDLGVQIAVVVGGGNIWRGRQAPGIERNRADYMGMLATVMNALALQDALEKIHVTTRVQTAISMSQLAEPFTPLRARRHLEKGRVVIFAAGLGVPFFSTDTCAAQRALEIGADALLKGTKVDGVYTADPHVDTTAVRFDSIEYVEVLKEGYQVMDATAISLCMENELPIIVFDLREEGNIRRVVAGEPIGTLVH